jgi:hypothetical protein
VAWVEDPGRSADAYQQVMPLATARLAMAQSAGPPTQAQVAGRMNVRVDPVAARSRCFPPAVRSDFATQTV